MYLERTVNGDWFDLKGMPNIDMGDCFVTIDEPRFVLPNECLELIFEYTNAL
jgi:hypothetical protein